MGGARHNPWGRSMAQGPLSGFNMGFIGKPHFFLHLNNHFMISIDDDDDEDEDDDDDYDEDDDIVIQNLYHSYYCCFYCTIHCGWGWGWGWWWWWWWWGWGWRWRWWWWCWWWIMMNYDELWIWGKHVNLTMLLSLEHVIFASPKRQTIHGWLLCSMLLRYVFAEWLFGCSRLEVLKLCVHLST